MIRRVVPRTLRARLTALIILSTSAILALSGLALYHALRNCLESSSIEQMSGTMAALRTHLAGTPTVHSIAGNAQTVIDRLRGHPHMALAIYDTAGQRLLSTAGFKPYAPIAAIVLQGAPAALARAGSNLRYLVQSVALNGGIGPPVLVAIQYDGTGDKALLRVYAYTTVAIEVLGVHLAAVFAYGIALVGLLPLRRLVARAEAMSTSGLAQPLPELHASGELKELEQAFNGMLARLDESFTRLSQFSSNLAHDMRTPLTNLLAAAQVALSQRRSAEDYRDVIESSVDEYRRLSRMIEDMLFLARSDQPDAPPSLRSLNAVAEAERVAGYYETVAEDAQVEIKVTGEGTVLADLLLFQRALSNLLSNALAQAPRGTTITVDCKEEQDWTTLSVSDSGAGIEARHLEHIFRRFYRVDPSRHGSASGTGLGLAIVKSIMTSHGGQCGCESRPHVRTCFWLRFPNHGYSSHGMAARPGRDAARKA
ncbi:heavy metal sensor histidine kinase [Paraburkholderia sp. BL18I3N2]|uniref:heavy metal sensor histidine kinase n=1 Tax=Paraburkholderia sp. BL18I3N2 TaxID=1938799 RepID=UPI000D05EB2B|nr:heavy metal sensor histidine kinase [Paraburkholderia sp. BL18I3N2]